MNPIYYHLFIARPDFEISDGLAYLGLAAIMIILVGGVVAHLHEYFKNRRPK